MSPEEAAIAGLITAFKPLIMAAHRVRMRVSRVPTAVRFGVEASVELDEIGCRCHVCAPCPWCLRGTEED